MIVNDYEENYITGFISVYRSILHNPFWIAEKFTRGQAWIDLLLLAKYKDGFFYKRDVRVSYKRGDVTEGIVNLSKRWKWSRTKTENFLKTLEKEQQINVCKSHVITIISLINYNKYQQKKQQKDNKKATRKQQESTHNKDNKDNKDNNIPAFKDFLDYALTKKPNIDVAALKNKYSSWVYNDWKDGNGKEIKSWKRKLNNTLPYISEVKKLSHRPAL